ncbi:aggregation-promoting factor C-terminal-like domain-containing protein [Amycolatopsis pigmentata]|uniref:LysM peptidoglycan-binding domain-containing protein n=1 Tax=Amycolatopsis pigmentata TaxID=450801 RepID=A0ABW5FSU0_9PSEU
MNTMLSAPLARSASRGLWQPLRRLVRGRARLLIAGLLLVGTAAGLLVTLQATTTTAAPTVSPAPSVSPAPAASAPAAPPQTTAPATPAPAPPAPAQSASTVTLHRGDTLWGLARRYRTTVAELQQLNQLGHSTLIRAGAALRIPADPVDRPAPQPRTAVASPAIGTSAVTSSHPLTAATAQDNGARQAQSAPLSGVQATAQAVFGSQYGCAANIITRESGWNPHATNPDSGAYGLAQALPGSKMARSGPNWRTDPATQLAWMRDYVTARYGGACNAWSFWQTHHWY